MTELPTGALGEGGAGDLPDEEEGVEPVELLVRLAEQGEIDPWDIDIVAVTDKFLDALDEGDLRSSGRALFYASVLLRMKSDGMFEDEEEDSEEEQWDPFEDRGPGGGPGMAPPEDGAFDPVAAVETERDRVRARRAARGRGETLDELVRELREAERGSWWKASRTYDTSESPTGFGRGTQTVDYRADDAARMGAEPTEEEVTGATHGEDIETTVAAVQETVEEQYAAGRHEVLFGEVENAGGSRVETFLACLFLANRGVVRMRQDELFGDLWLQDPDADLGSEAAVAD
jgi:segregation and condensation protein A